MPPYRAPASVLIVGSGVFGLSTAEALCRRPAFAHTAITVVDRGSGADDGSEDDPDDDDDDAALEQHFPARDAASIDSSRIIRADYADPAYAALAAAALARWRGQERWPGDGDDDNNDDNEDYIGGDGRYTESGLVVVADEEEPTTTKTGMDYVRASWANVQALAAADPYLADRLTLLPSPDAIRAAVGTGGVSGAWGYHNGASGWADAAASMAWLLRRVRRTGRVKFVRGRVTALTVEASAVTGVRLADGRCLTADQTIVAAGAWTAALLAPVDAPAAAGNNPVDQPSGPPLPIHRCLAATGQTLAYVPLDTPADHAHVARMPVVLNLSSGLFVLPPAPHARELKVARHAYGYLHPQPVANTPLSPSLSLSVPLTAQDRPGLAIPPAAAAALRRGLRAIVARPGLVDRPFARTRLCWYTDTPAADFLVAAHPRRARLFVATGGSGHAFKFLPVLGDAIVDCLVGEPPAAFRSKWAWPLDDGTVSASSAVVTEDGSRGGRPGLDLEEELAKTETEQ